MKKRIEESTVNLLRKGKQQAKVRIPRAEAFTRMSNPQEGMVMDQKEFPFYHFF